MPKKPAAAAASRPTIAIDTYGGNVAPRAAVAAAAQMARDAVARVVLVGDAGAIQDQLSLLAYDPAWLRVVHTGVKYPRHADDAAAVRDAACAALPIAMELLREGDADALVTASPPTAVRDAVRAGLSMLHGARTLPLAAVFPCMPRAGRTEPLALLLDVSGTRAASADELVEFALLGSAYTRVVTGVASPAVALLSTGPGPDDGPPEVVAAHRILRTMVGLHFVGNLRATDVARGHADVIVADGLLGHTVRGLLEGLTTMTVEAARYAWRTKVAWRMALRLLSQGVGMLKTVSEFQEYGGAPLLGCDHLVLIAHADSAPPALANAIKLATRCTARGLTGALRMALADRAGPGVLAAP